MRYTRWGYDQLAACPMTVLMEVLDMMRAEYEARNAE